jgi:hypothetical protein
LSLDFTPGVAAAGGAEAGFFAAAFPDSGLLAAGLEASFLAVRLAAVFFSTGLGTDLAAGFATALGAALLAAGLAATFAVARLAAGLATAAGFTGFFALVAM